MYSWPQSPGAAVFGLRWVFGAGLLVLLLPASVEEKAPELETGAFFIGRTTLKTFPIMQPWRVRHRALEEGLIVEIPWELIAFHEAQARRNHRQSLEQLAYRGGLSPCEAIAVIEDRPWRSMPDAEEVLRTMIAALPVTNGSHEPESPPGHLT